MNMQANRTLTHQSIVVDLNCRLVIIEMGVVLRGHRDSLSTAPVEERITRDLLISVPRVI